MSVRFRSAQIADVPGIAEMLTDLFSIEQDFRPDLARHVSALKLMLAREDILLWVGEGVTDGVARVVAFCSVQTLISTAEGGPVGLLEDVVVASAWRGTGVGRRLLEGAEVWARRRGCTRLQLLADQGNAAALDFYAHIGWQETRMHTWRKMLREEV